MIPFLTRHLYNIFFPLQQLLGCTLGIVEMEMTSVSFNLKISSILFRHIFQSVNYTLFSFFSVYRFLLLFCFVLFLFALTFSHLLGAALCEQKGPNAHIFGSSLSEGPQHGKIPKCCSSVWSVYLCLAFCFWCQLIRNNFLSIGLGRKR